MKFRKKKIRKNTIPYSDNIIILCLDSISRNNVLRKLKKTIKFFEKFISYKWGNNKNYPNENFRSFQFFKYHLFSGYTGNNFPPLFYGNTANAKDFIRITKYSKENGYITGFAKDYCQKDGTRTYHNFTKKDLYDHQLLLCDPNSSDLNSIRIRCLYGNLNSYYLYKYINQFWIK